MKRKSQRKSPPVLPGQLDMFAIALEAPAKKPVAKPRACVSAPKSHAPKKRGVQTVKPAKETAPCAVLRVQDAALHVGLSVSTLNKMRGDGRGPRFIKLTHKVVGYAVDDLDAWLMSRRDSAS
jgi:predicted DNA-binding transcriptional regulator AlpA